MVCFEIYRNGERLCQAGIGEFGLLRAEVMWLSHEPEKLARWEAEGMSSREPVTLNLAVDGAVGEGAELEQLKWGEVTLSIGDEVRIRVVDAPEADAPRERHRDAAPTREMMEAFVRQQAEELGWEIRG